MIETENPISRRACQYSKSPTLQISPCTGFVIGVLLAYSFAEEFLFFQNDLMMQKNPGKAQNNIEQVG